MRLAKVVGNVVSTVKDEGYNGKKTDVGGIF